MALPLRLPGALPPNRATGLAPPPVRWRPARGVLLRILAVRIDSISIPQARRPVIPGIRDGRLFLFLDQHPFVHSSVLTVAPGKLA